MREDFKQARPLNENLNWDEQGQRQTHKCGDMNFLTEAPSHTAACIRHNCACRPVCNKMFAQYGKIIDN